MQGPNITSMVMRVNLFFPYSFFLLTGTKLEQNWYQVDKEVQTIDCIEVSKRHVKASNLEKRYLRLAVFLCGE